MSKEVGIAYKHRISRIFVDNLLKRKKEWLFRFVIDPKVESTNNRAERALRLSVIYSKVTGGTRSENGSEDYAKLSSIMYISILQKKSFILDTPGKVEFRKRTHPG